MQNNHYHNKNNNSQNKKLKIIFLTAILSFGAITNIFLISSFSTSFAFLKDAQALETKEYMLEHDKKKKENNYKDSKFDNDIYLNLESDLSPMKLNKNNYYYNHDNYYESDKIYSDKYNTNATNINEEVIECNNFDLNVNSGLTANDNGYENNNNNNNINDLIGLEQIQEKETKINTDDNKPSYHSYYDSKDSSISIICKQLNFNDQQPSPPVDGASLSINKDWFVCDNYDINCIIQGGGQTSFEGSTSGNYTQCFSEQDCLFANDAGFNIEITGNDPIPNTVPAQVNTRQQIDIRAGPFAVTEELFSDELVPDANFGVQNVPVGSINAQFSPSAPIITFDETGQRVFTANFNNDSVSIIDLENANNVTNVPLAPSGGDFPLAIAFDEAGQRVFTANINSDSISIIDLDNANNVTDVDLAPFGGDSPRAIAFDEAGQRVFTANADSDSVSVIDLTTTPITVTDIPLAPSGGLDPVAIAFDEAGQRVFTANADSDSVSIIDLNNPDPNTAVTNVDLAPTGGDAPIAIAFDEAGLRVFTANAGSNSVSIITNLNNPIPTVTDVPLSPTGGNGPISIVFDEAGQRVFTANAFSSSVSIIDLLSTTVSKICQDSGFDTGDIRTSESNGQTFQQISCVNFVGECSGDIEDGKTRVCTVEDYVVALDEVSNGEMGILANINKP